MDTGTHTLIHTCTHTCTCARQSMHTHRWPARAHAHFLSSGPSGLRTSVRLLPWQYTELLTPDSIFPAAGLLKEMIDKCPNVRRPSRPHRRGAAISLLLFFYFHLHWKIERERERVRERGSEGGRKGERGREGESERGRERGSE